VKVPAPFAMAGDHIGIDLPGGGVLFTTRRGGVSEGPFASLNLGLGTDDDPERVGENRERLAAQAGVARERFAHGRQVHGTEVRRVTALAHGAPSDADGQATALAGVAPVVVVADCLPIALVAREAVAMVHAGWRGLAGGIVGEGVAALRELGAGAFRAAIGPGAGPCCYEVGAEVHAALGTSGRTADLKAVAREQLEAAGAQEVHDVGLCTLCAGPELFFSHRRDGGVTGRQAGVAWRS
jgi:YfiH family protein